MLLPLPPFSGRLSPPLSLIFSLMHTAMLFRQLMMLLIWRFTSAPRDYGTACHRLFEMRR